MQDFDFEVVYRSGTQVKHVDYLSRNPTRNVECLTIDITEPEWIRAAQLQDDINIIREILESGYITPDVKQYFDKYDLRNGVVFRRIEKGNKSGSSTIMPVERN